MTEFLLDHHFHPTEWNPLGRYRTPLTTSKWIAIRSQIIGNENRVEAETEALAEWRASQKQMGKLGFNPKA